MKMTEVQTVQDLRQYLAAHGAVEGYHFVVGALGSGEVSGITCEEGAWLTYYSQRGSRTGITEWPDEVSACAALLPKAMAKARITGDWRD